MFTKNLFLEIISKGVPSTNPLASNFCGCEYVPVSEATYFLWDLCNKYNKFFSLRPLDFVVVRSENEMSMIVKFTGPQRKVSMLAHDLAASEHFLECFLVNVKSPQMLSLH